MVTQTHRFDTNKERVFLDIGYAADCVPSARMVSLVNNYIENAHQLIEPRYSYAIRNIESAQESRVNLEDLVVFESEVIARLLERAQTVAVFTLTIGSHLETTVAQLADDGRILQAAVLDAVGSSIVEKLADFVQGKISEIAHAQGLVVSRRFSPGYCDWDVGQQKMVFRAMRGDYAGIQLTDGCLMMPRKSISGIIALGNIEVENYNPCTACDKKDCVGRRENQGNDSKGIAREQL